MELIDFHAHLEPTAAARERLLASMASNGVSQSVVVAGRVMSPKELSRNVTEGFGGNYPVPNRAVLDTCAPTLGRLLPFYFANPFESPDEYRAIGHRFYGLKFAPIVHGVPLNDSRNQRYIDESKAFGHSLYLHLLARPGFDTPALVQLVEANPSVSIVLGHAGLGTLDFCSIDAIAPFPNAHLETSGGFSAVIRYALEKLGPDRVVFGSEYPIQEPAVEILKARLTGISEKTSNANAKRLLGLGGPRDQVA